VTLAMPSDAMVRDLAASPCNPPTERAERAIDGSERSR